MKVDNAAKHVSRVAKVAGLPEQDQVDLYQQLGGFTPERNDVGEGTVPIITLQLSEKPEDT